MACEVVGAFWAALYDMLGGTYLTNIHDYSQASVAGNLNAGRTHAFAS